MEPKKINWPPSDKRTEIGPDGKKYKYTEHAPTDVRPVFTAGKDPTHLPKELIENWDNEIEESVSSRLDQLRNEAEKQSEIDRAWEQHNQETHEKPDMVEGAVSAIKEVIQSDGTWKNQEVPLYGAAAESARNKDINVIRKKMGLEPLDKSRENQDERHKQQSSQSYADERLNKNEGRVTRRPGKKDQALSTSTGGHVRRADLGQLKGSGHNPERTTTRPKTTSTNEAPSDANAQGASEKRGRSKKSQLNKKQLAREERRFLENEEYFNDAGLEYNESAKPNKKTNERQQMPRADAFDLDDAVNMAEFEMHFEDTLKKSEEIKQQKAVFNAEKAQYDQLLKNERVRTALYDELDHLEPTQRTIEIARRNLHKLRMEQAEAEFARGPAGVSPLSITAALRNTASQQTEQTPEKKKLMDRFKGYLKGINNSNLVATGKLMLTNPSIESFQMGVAEIGKAPSRAIRKISEKVTWLKNEANRTGSNTWSAAYLGASVLLAGATMLGIHAASRAGYSDGFQDALATVSDPNVLDPNIPAGGSGAGGVETPDYSSASTGRNESMPNSAPVDGVTAPDRAEPYTDAIQDGRSPDHTSPELTPEMTTRTGNVLNWESLNEQISALPQNYSAVRGDEVLNILERYANDLPVLSDMTEAEQESVFTNAYEKMSPEMRAEIGLSDNWNNLQPGQTIDVQKFMDYLATEPFEIGGQQYDSILAYADMKDGVSDLGRVAYTETVQGEVTTSESPDQTNRPTQQANEEARRLRGEIESTQETIDTLQNEINTIDQSSQGFDERLAEIEDRGAQIDEVVDNLSQRIEDQTNYGVDETYLDTLTESIKAQKLEETKALVEFIAQTAPEAKIDLVGAIQLYENSPEILSYRIEPINNSAEEFRHVFVQKGPNGESEMFEKIFSIEDGRVNYKTEQPVYIPQENQKTSSNTFLGGFWNWLFG